MRNEVELLTIGDELLLGFTIDTNGAVLARALAGAGVTVVRRTAVGDTIAAIAAAISEALDRTGAVITTGGLGPTTDDVTRDAVAQVFSVPLEVDEAHIAWMQERWRRRFGRDMPEANRRQAMIPRGARKLENRHGSAPGAFVQDTAGRWVVMLPGVPRELRGMTEDTVRPLLLELGCGATSCIRSLTLRTTGVPESLVQDQLRDLSITDEMLSLAYLPGVDGVDLRITAHARDAGSADAALQIAAAAIRDRMGDSIYGTDDADLARIVIELLRARRLSVAVAESCTGGLLGTRITEVPGSSDVFLGGVIAYANEVKVRELGVSPEVLAEEGAVSEAVVEGMARGVRTRFNASVGMAITGVAGPGGGTPDKPVGLVWVGVATADRIETRRLQSWGDRKEIRYRATQTVLDLARRLV